VIPTSFSLGRITLAWLSTDVVTQPYSLYPRAFVDIQALIKRFKIKVVVSAVSSHFPGQTLGIYIMPTEETYRVLGLKPSPGLKIYYRG
jgi:hypothetical protein